MRFPKWLALPLFSLTLLLALAACGGDATPTEVAEQASATRNIPTATRGALTAAPPSATPPVDEPAAGTATGVPLGVTTPTLPPTATETATPTATPPCQYDLQYLGDLTVPDGTQFLPGQPIDKQWSVRNTGTCDWGPNHRLVLVSGNALGPRSEAALYPARAGAEAVIQLAMQAPQEPGEYTGRWQARDPDGRLFGDVIFIVLSVIPLPVTDTPPPP